jgi:hypothetical protein
VESIPDNTSLDQAVAYANKIARLREAHARGEPVFAINKRKMRGKDMHTRSVVFDAHSTARIEKEWLLSAPNEYQAREVTHESLVRIQELLGDIRRRIAECTNELETNTLEHEHRQRLLDERTALENMQQQILSDLNDSLIRTSLHAGTPRT